MTLPQTVNVELTLYATVTVTQEVLDGVQEAYPGLYEECKDDPKVLARAIVYASVNPRLPYSNERIEDPWDGVCDMQGLIHKMELDYR